MKKQLPFAIYNALLCVLTAAALLFACLCVEAAEEKYYLKWDVSPDRVSELSEYTLEKLNALSQDVVFYPVYASALSSDLRDLQTETLMKMASVCQRVRVEEIDANAQPQMLLQLAGETQGIADGTVFVANGEGTRVVRIDAEEFLFSRRIEEEIYTIYCGEAQLIGAVKRVCTDNPVAVWFLTGHGEAGEAECGQLALQLRAMGFEVHSGALGMIQPDAQDVLMLVNPQTDLTGGEVSAMKAFLDAGGDLVLSCGADTPFDRLPALLSLCDVYGLGYQAGWTVESSGETSYFIEKPEWLSPALTADNGVIESLSGRMILTRSCALSAAQLRPGMESIPLLVTSSEAALKQDASGDPYALSEADTTGRMTLALLAYSGDMHILQLASTEMLMDDAAITGASVLDASENLAFISACLEAMTDQGSGATLDAGVKQLAAQLITFPSEQEKQAVSLLLLLALPCAILLAMSIVLVRRRRL